MFVCAFLILKCPCMFVKLVILQNSLSLLAKMKCGRVSASISDDSCSHSLQSSVKLNMTRTSYHATSFLLPQGWTHTNIHMLFGKVISRNQACASDCLIHYNVTIKTDNKL